eukprot:Plantae.Rhodophyta-Hildenbrandia_rubra.ctg2376.p1 GENE.Plantae.Rhodophyta-Hildenbrandia_rubra.ctg2376~~Plantae.Rhodophyta-Hildenbrandia_rubra.ctg2376.p1  ORF type:complete len:425 (-),score=38.38 Plantae.Rhodophyta-Hildenbrandia_rubra.ctg2376:942-2216(-)
MSRVRLDEIADIIAPKELSGASEIHSVLSLAEVSVILLISAWSYDSVIAASILNAVSASFADHVTRGDVQFCIARYGVSDIHPPRPPQEDAFLGKVMLRGGFAAQRTAFNATRDFLYTPGLRLYWNKGANAVNYHGSLTADDVSEFIAATVPTLPLHYDTGKIIVPGFTRLSPEKFNFIKNEMPSRESALMILFMNFADRVPEELIVKIQTIQSFCRSSRWVFGTVDLDIYEEFGARFEVTRSQSPALVLFDFSLKDLVVETLHHSTMIHEPLGSILGTVDSFERGGGFQSCTNVNMDVIRLKNNNVSYESKIYHPLLHLSKEMFNSEAFRHRRAWIIVHSPSCAFSQRAMPFYREAARSLRGEGTDLYEYDVSRYQLPAFMDSFVDGYPTVLVWDANGPWEYEGPHDVSSIVSEVTAFYDAAI